MPTIIAQVTIPHRSLVAADNVMNTFHFTTFGDPALAAENARTRLNRFYNDIPDEGSVPLKNFWSGELNPAQARIKVYDLSDPEPRVPVMDEPLGLTAASPLSSDNLPGEVCLAFSYRAALESGVSRARSRGRIYFGPLNRAVLSGANDFPARPTAALILNGRMACKELADDNDDGLRWVVWSRRDEEAYEIVAGHVDNAFDTQRRRGVEMTVRGGWEAGPA